MFVIFRITKLGWLSLKWNWPLPTSETWTAGALKSTRPSKTSGMSTLDLCLCTAASPACVRHVAWHAAAPMFLHAFSTNKELFMLGCTWYLICLFMCVREECTLSVWSFSSYLNTYSASYFFFIFSKTNVGNDGAPRLRYRLSFSQVDIVHLHICLNLTVGGCGMSRHDFQFSYKQILQDHLLILATQFRKCPYNKSLVTLYSNLRSHISQTIPLYSYSKGWGQGF